MTIEDAEDERKLRANGIYPKALEEFEEQLPEISEGDFLIGGNLREDFKPFVYSGLASEFPVNGESVFIITERGEEAHQSSDYEEIVQADPEIERNQAYEVFEAQNANLASAVITEELLTRYRRQSEHQLKETEGENWQNYLDFGTEILNAWEETYQKASRVEDEEVSDYAKMVGEQIDKLTSDLTQLAQERDSRYIENVRNSIYELENLTDHI